MDMLRYLGMGLLGAVTLTSTASAQSRWDGADDLPVSPLACGEGGPDSSEAYRTSTGVGGTGEGVFTSRRASASVLRSGARLSLRAKKITMARESTTAAAARRDGR